MTQTGKTEDIREIYTFSYPFQNTAVDLHDLAKRSLSHVVSKFFLKSLWFHEKAEKLLKVASTVKMKVKLDFNRKLKFRNVHKQKVAVMQCYKHTLINLRVWMHYRC